MLFYVMASILLCLWMGHIPSAFKRLHSPGGGAFDSFVCMCSPDKISGKSANLGLLAEKYQLIM
jgi:hypothetical protein